MTPTSSAPINKVSLPFLAGAALAVVFWALHSYTSIVIDAEGAVLISTLVGGLIGYFTPIAPGEITNRDAVIVERSAHDAETKPIETRPL